MKRTPLKRKSRLSPVSAKRKVEMKEYSKKRKAFLDRHPICQLWLEQNGYDRNVNVERIGCFFNIGTRLMEDRYLVQDVPLSCDVHHMKKRGKNYLDESTWAALSRNAHAYIESHKSWARANGWLE